MGWVIHQPIFIMCEIKGNINVCVSIFSATIATTTGVLGRVKWQGCDPDKAFIMVTTENIRFWLKISTEINHLVEEITKFSITFQCHHDKFNNAIDHTATFLFEWVFASMFKGIPGYVLEQFFNLGLQELWVGLVKKEDVLMKSFTSWDELFRKASPLFTHGFVRCQ